MEVTRKAFMNLPDPSSPDYHIPDDSMTALINFFFLHRRRPKLVDYPKHLYPRRGILGLLDRIDKWRCREIRDYDNKIEIIEHLNRIEKWLHRNVPGLPKHFRSGSGGSPTVALYLILDRLRQEGYVKGLEKDVWGIYTTRVTCKTCGYEYKKLRNEIMVTFYSELADKLQFFQYLTDHEAVANKVELQKELDNAQQEGKGNNSITRFLSVQHLFNFAEPSWYSEEQGRLVDDLDRHDQSKSWKVSCGAYDIRFRTTFNQFPLNLIIEMEYISIQFPGCMIIDEFIDLSVLAESDTTPTVNAKYKLVVVGEIVENGDHTISYVRASKYANEIYCPDHPSVNIARENMWYKVDDYDVELVPFSSVWEGMHDHNLLIYEKEEQQLSTVQTENEQQRLIAQNENEKVQQHGV